MRYLPLALLMTGCMGPSPETLVPELRVMAMVAEPPEIGPGESSTITWYVADPEDNGAEAASWTCAFTGEGCLEDALELERLSYSGDAVPTFQVEVTAPVEAAGVLAAAELDEIPWALWSLACEPGVCPMVETAKDGGDPDPDDLARPFEMMEDLPIVGASLGTSSMFVSTRPPEERRANPLIQPDFASIEVGTVETGTALDFRVRGTGTLTGYGYATAGGFQGLGTEAADNRLPMVWFPPEEPTDLDVVDLWVVVVDEAGGTAVWTGSVPL